MDAVARASRRFASSPKNHKVRQTLTDGILEAMVGATATLTDASVGVSGSQKVLPGSCSLPTPLPGLKGSQGCRQSIRRRMEAEEKEPRSCDGGFPEIFSR